MIALDGMRHLRLLWLNRTTITGAGLMYLQDHVRLENLSKHGCYGIQCGTPTNGAPELQDRRRPVINRRPRGKTQWSGA
jgi:hypothetical protein